MKNKKEYPYLCESRLSYIYRCVECGAFIKKGMQECYRCEHIFSKDDVDIMIKQYRKNYKKTGIINFILSFLSQLLYTHCSFKNKKAPWYSTLGKYHGAFEIVEIGVNPTLYI